MDGPFETHYPSGQLQERGTHTDGERDGPYGRYSENGQLMSKGTYNMGERCGEWLELGRTLTYPPC